MANLFKRSFSRANAGVYKLSGGRIGSRFGKAPILLLTSTGRKSGKERTWPLIYIREGEALAVIASDGGSDQAPGWWLNLQANPRGSVQVKDESWEVEASKGSQEQRERLWPQFVAIHKSCDSYQQKTTRQIPVILLSPIAGHPRALT